MNPVNLALALFEQEKNNYPTDQHELLLGVCAELVAKL